MGNKKKKMNASFKGRQVKKRKGFNTLKIIVYCAALAAILLVYYFLASKSVVVEDNKEIEYSFRKDGEAYIKGINDEVIVKIDIEIAADGASRNQGLMFREYMGELQGMLFIFERTQEISMWMRNTIIPLDMLFIDADKKIVDIALNTTPFSEEQIVAKVPVMYVIEVNAGFVEKYGIETGQMVSW